MSLVRFLLVLASATWSAPPREDVFGYIKYGDGVIERGVKIEITCRGKTYSGETDEFGSYRIYVAENGQCTLIAHFRGQAPSLPVYSYDTSVRYNLRMVEGDGRYSLERI